MTFPQPQTNLAAVGPTPYLPDLGTRDLKGRPPPADRPPGNPATTSSPGDRTPSREEFAPTVDLDDDTSREPNDGPVVHPKIRLSNNMGGLSCLNADCSHLVEGLSEWDIENLQLPCLGGDHRWVRFCLETSPLEVWSIFARFLPSSQFPENILCSRHALTRDAIICVNDSPPTIHLNRREFILDATSTLDVNVLFLHFPLERGVSAFCHLPHDALIPREREATFLPSSHGLNYATLDHDSAQGILSAAGIHRDSMNRWTQSHLLDTDDEVAMWHLMGLRHVREHWHLPTVDISASADSSSDDDDHSPLLHPNPWRKVCVTSLDRLFPRPRVRVAVSAQDTHVPTHRLGSSRLFALVDVLAPFPLMSRSCALHAQIDLDSLDVPNAGYIFELSTGLDRRSQLGRHFSHHTRYWGLGHTTIRCNFATTTSSAHWVSVKVMIFEDRTLDRLSCLDFIFHRAFMDEMAAELVAAMCSDPMSAALARSADHESYLAFDAADSPPSMQHALDPGSRTMGFERYSRVIDSFPPSGPSKLTQTKGLELSTIRGIDQSSPAGPRDVAEPTIPEGRPAADALLKFDLTPHTNHVPIVQVWMQNAPVDKKGVRTRSSSRGTSRSASRDNLAGTSEQDAAVPALELGNSRHGAWARSLSSGAVSRFITAPDGRETAPGPPTKAAPPSRIPTDLASVPSGRPEPPTTASVEPSGSAAEGTNNAIPPRNRAPPGGGGDDGGDDDDGGGDDPHGNDNDSSALSRCRHCGMLVSLGIDDSWKKHMETCSAGRRDSLVSNPTGDQHPLEEVLPNVTAESSLSFTAQGADCSPAAIVGVSYEPDVSTLGRDAYQSRVGSSAVKPERSPSTSTPADERHSDAPPGILSPLSQ